MTARETATAARAVMLLDLVVGGLTREAAEAKLVAYDEATAAPALAEPEAQMLRYALDLAQDKIWSGDGFTDDDQAALDSLRRMANQPTTKETK